MLFGIFAVFFRSSVIPKKLKRPGFYTLVFYIFINNSRSKQNEKNPEQAFVGIIKWEISAKNIKVRGSWSPSKFSIFYDRLPGFSEIIGLSLNLGFGFCITWLVLSNYKKIGP